MDRDRLSHLALQYLGFRASGEGIMFTTIPNAKEFLKAVDESFAYLKSCPVSELGMYINHPAKTVREFVQGRLNGKIQ